MGQSNNKSESPYPSPVLFAQEHDQDAVGINYELQISLHRRKKK